MEILVGRVAALFRYPVKSMAAESLAVGDVSWHGLAGDRRWAFRRPDLGGSGFPWLTLRQRNDLNAYRPRLADPSRPNACQVLVTTPSGRDVDVLDPALADELGGGVLAMKLDRGTFDSAPLSLLTTGTLDGLGDLLGQRPDVRRFRPNVVVETFPNTGYADAGFAEDGWVGSTLRLGGCRIRVDRRDHRCVVVTIDPRTGTRDPAILRTIVRARQNCLGVYGTTVEPGVVAVDDPVLVVNGESG